VCAPALPSSHVSPSPHLPISPSFAQTIIDDEALPTSLRTAAADAVDFGLSILYPTPKERKQLLTTLISKVWATHNALSGARDPCHSPQLNGVKHTCCRECSTYLLSAPSRLFVVPTNSLCRCVCVAPSPLLLLFLLPSGWHH
jgi:hypothetical protein